MSNASPAPNNPLFSNLRRWFLTGLVIAAPVSITIYIIWSFVGMVDGWVGALLPIRFGHNHVIRSLFPGFGLIVVTLTLTLVGALTANVAGRSLVYLGEWVVTHTPFVGSLYSTLKQIFETVVSDKSGSFREVVLVQFPHPGVWTLGFVTGQPTAPLKSELPEGWINVYIPTTPNPTGGYLIYVRRSEAKTVNMTVDEALKYVVSLGIAGESVKEPVPFRRRKPE